MRYPLFFSSLIFLAAMGSAVTAEQTLTLDDATARASYSLGYQMGQDLERQGVTFHRAAALAGLSDGRAGRDARIGQEEMQALLGGLKHRILRRQAASRREEHESLRRAGSEFLEQNRSEPGVQTTQSGVQYKVLKKGSGPRPGPTDKVRAHYRGTTVDGKEFSNTRARNEPAEFTLDGIMAGWSEGIQLMREGAVYELYIPYNLAYNARGPLAYQTLIMEVELLKVNPESGEPSGGSR